MKILVVRLSSMGDTILASAAFTYLAGRFPGAQIHFVTRAPYASLFENNTMIHAVHRYDPLNASAVSCPEDWDMAIDLQNSARSRTLLRRVAPSCPPSRFRKLRFRRLVLLALRVDLYPLGDSVIRRYLTACGWNGDGETPATPCVQIQPEWSKSSDPMLPGGTHDKRPMLAILPFAAWRNKQWPIERYEETARRFIGRGWRVVVAGGPEDTERGQQIAESLGEACVSLAGAVPLTHTAAALSRCHVAIGGDTGLVHLARAVGAPTVVIYGSTTRHFGFFPFGQPPFRILQTNLCCRPCNAHGGSFCWRMTRPCLGQISVEAAVGALDTLIAEKQLRAAQSYER